jgi:hypothetical protein
MAKGNMNRGSGKTIGFQFASKPMNAETRPKNGCSIASSGRDTPNIWVIFVRKDSYCFAFIRKTKISTFCGFKVSTASLASQRRFSPTLAGR